MTTRRVGAVKASLTLALTAKAKAMRAEGRDVVAFTAGELDFAPPPAVAEAVTAALAAGLTRYTPVAGIPSLRDAIADRLEADLGHRYDPATEIVVTCGAKHALFNLVQVLCDPGTELLIPSPFWLSYESMALLAEATPVQVACGADFKLGPDALAAAITPETRAVVLNSPGNPTGAVYTADELRALADVLAAHPHVTVISDEIYNHLVYDGRSAPSIATVAPELRERTVVVNGASKSFAMTGFRIGWAAGPKAIIGAAIRLQSHQTSGATSIAQAGAEAALRRGMDSIPPIVEELEGRRDRMVELLRAIDGVTIDPPQGAFYCFASVAGVLADGETALDLCTRVLDETGVAMVPGDPFGAADHVRLSFALSRADIEKGLERVAAFLKG